MEAINLPDINIEVWKRGSKVLTIIRHKVIEDTICCWISNGDKLKWNQSKMWINNNLVYDCQDGPDLIILDLYKWYLLKNGYKIL